MHEIVEAITSTRMPDGDYPKFKLFETENIILVQFSWGELEVGVVMQLPVKIDAIARGMIKEFLILDAAEIFTLKVDQKLSLMEEGD